MTQTSFARIKGWAGMARDKATRAALLPVVALMASPAFAALPEIDLPSDTMSGIEAGGWLGGMSGLFKVGFTIGALILTALVMLVVIMGGVGKWRSYSLGRIEMSDLVEYMIMGVVVVAFGVFIAGYLMTTIE